MEHATIVALRLVHIVMGALWVGAVIFVARFLMPSLQAAGGPVAGAVMDQLMKHKMPRFMMGAMALTILSGLGLMYMVSGGFGHDWFVSRMGHVISIGAALAIAGSLVGVAVNMPTSKKIAAIVESAKAAGGPPSAAQQAELAALQKKMAGGTKATAVLLGLAAAAMAVARYV